METTPFVHLLKSPYHHYAYDVNTNSIVSISKELFNYLRSIENSGASIPDNNPPQKVDLEIKRLKEQGYLKEKRPVKIENPVIDYLPYLLENHLGQLILQVTQQCNFRCSYCPYTIEEGETTRNHSNKRMSWEIAKAAIDFYKEHTRDSKILYISFYGGEPLLEWSLIKRCIEYAENILSGKHLKLNMTTNASLLTEEIAQFLVEHNVHILISLDGPASIHNRSRRFASNGEGTFEAVSNILETLKRTVPGFSKLLSYNSVVDPCNDIHCVVNFFSEQNFEINNVKTSVFTPPPGTSVYYPEEYRTEDKYAEFISLLRQVGLCANLDRSVLEKGHEDSYNRFISHMNQYHELADTMSHSGPCTPGAQRLFVTSQGDIFPCEKCSETSESMCLGNIYSGLNFKKVMNLANICMLTEDDCQNCWAIRHCTICPVQADNYGKLSKKTILSKCPFVRKGIEKSLERIIAVKELQSDFIWEDAE